MTASAARIGVSGFGGALLVSAPSSDLRWRLLVLGMLVSGRESLLAVTHTDRHTRTHTEGGGDA